MLKRVVVTGLGVVSPNGSDLKTFWDNIREGRTEIGPITRFDASLFRTRIGSEIKNFDPSLLLDRNTIKRTDIFTQYALLSANQAIIDAGFDFSKMDPFEIGVIWGTGQGGMETYEEQVAELGRQLLAKMKLTDEDVDAAFAVLEKMPIQNNGGHSYEN